jgi:hypothetical protein
MSNIDPAEAELVELCQGKDWFACVGRDQYKRLVVYVHYMTGGVSNLIPDRTSDGQQVLMHWYDSKFGKKEDYMGKVEPTKFHTLTSTPIPTPTQFIEMAREAQKRGIDTGFGQIMDEMTEEQQLELRVRHLTDELDKLEKICGTNILGDIFFEIHDGSNAVTNLSIKYPEVREKLQSLYHQFGFDILYEELEL